MDRHAHVALDALALKVGLEEEHDPPTALRVGEHGDARPGVFEGSPGGVRLVLVLGDPLDRLDRRGEIVDERIEVFGSNSLERLAAGGENVRVDDDALHDDGLPGALLLREGRQADRDQEESCDDRVTGSHGPL